MKSLNQIIAELEAFATAHYQIHAFGHGDVWEISPQSDRIIYPLLWLVPQTATPTLHEVSQTFTVLCMDLVDSGERNETEVLSDTQRIILDVCTYYRQQHDQDYIIEFGGQIQSFTEAHPERVSGNSISITIRQPFEYNACAIPAAPITPPPVPTCADATIFNAASNPTYQATVASGGSLVLPQLKVLDSDGVTPILADYIPESDGFAVSCSVPVCPDGTVNITDSATNPIASVQVASGGVEPFPLPDTPVQAVDSAATVGASGNVLSVTGGDVAIPDKDYTDSDGVVKSVAAFAPIVCTPQAAPVYPAEWVENPQWAAEPITLTEAEQFCSRFLVREDTTFNRASLTVTSGVDVDFGDGAVVTSTGAMIAHEYDYATIAATVYNSPVIGNYKQVFVRTVGTVTSLALSPVTTLADRKVDGWADILADIPNCTVFQISSTQAWSKLSHLERVRVSDLAANCSVTNLLLRCSSMGHLEMPWDKIGGSAGMLGGGCGPIMNLLDLSSFTGSLGPSALNGNAQRYGDVDLSNVGSVNIFNGAALREIGTATATGNLTGYFRDTYALQSPVRIISTAALTNISLIVAGSATPFLRISNCTSVSNAANFALNANLSNGLELVGLTIGFNVANTNATTAGMAMQAAVQGAQSGADPIVVTGTPFGADLIALDAAALAVEATFNGLGYTITN